MTDRSSPADDSTKKKRKTSLHDQTDVTNEIEHSSMRTSVTTEHTLVADLQSSAFDVAMTINRNDVVDDAECRDNKIRNANSAFKSDPKKSRDVTYIQLFVAHNCSSDRDSGEKGSITMVFMRHGESVCNVEPKRAGINLQR